MQQYLSIFIFVIFLFSNCSLLEKENAQNKTPDLPKNHVESLVSDTAFQMDNRNVNHRKKAFALETKKISLPIAIEGAMVYHIDDSMIVEQVSYAELKIGNQEKEVLIEEIKRINLSRKRELQDSDIQTERITISENMKAQLVDPTGGERFRIVALSSQEQKLDLSGQHSTTWQWAITPQRAGLGELIISIDVLVDGVAKSFPVYQAKVSILSHKNKQAWIKRNWWVFIIFILLILTIGLLLRRYMNNNTHANARSHQIFISYRRADSAGFTISLYKELEKKFKNKVFKDIEDIPVGADFRNVLQDNLQSSKIVIVVIGQQWLSISDEKGNKRLFDLTDFVNIEVATAIELGKTVIPVLVDGASMPKESDLPDNIKSIAFLNAITLPHDNWDSSVAKLIKQMRVWL